ncbi:MAG: isoprenylcysteine carboxylmethyltransferase family protein [Oscillospiraceae bacterium]|nr:isoprenylcysteine carboxylmethyltransferase family protein [Oscillospiraceae bacterium]
MKRKLLISALSKYILGLLMVTFLLFLPAGTIAYFNGWLFIALLFVPMLLLGVILLLKAPDLLKKRLNHKEKEGGQKQVIGLSLLMFVGGFVAAGLDFRFGWTAVPNWLSILSSVLLLLSYGLYAEVMRENAYLSRTIEVQENQKVVDSGLYGIVRHPMYAVTTLLFLSIPLVLGSWVSFAIFLLYPCLLMKRVRNEEAVLEQGLEGYIEYKKKVRWRMIPFVW